MPEQPSGPYGDASGLPTHGNLFVGSLQAHITESDLQELFKECGDINFCKVMVNPLTGQSKGSAFVEFGNPSNAQAAIDKLNGHEGWVVKFANNAKGAGKGAGKGKPATPAATPGQSSNLYILGLPSPECDKDTLHNLFEDLGHTVLRTKTIVDSTGRGSSAAMVELGSPAQAQDAINKLHGQTPSRLPECNLSVSFANQKPQPGQTPTGPSSPGGPLVVKYAGQDSSIASANLYITGLPSPPPSQSDISYVFSQLGYTVVRAKTIPDTQGRGMTAAMVQLEDQEQAAGAIGVMNGETWVSMAGETGGGATKGLVVKYAGQDPSVASPNLYITGLPSPAPGKDDIERVFQGLGYSVVRTRVIEDTKGKGESAAMVQLKTQEEAEAAIAMLNGELWPSPEPQAAAAGAPVKALATMTPASVPTDTSESLSEALPKLASACGRKWTELAAQATRLEEKHWLSTIGDLQMLNDSQWARLELPVKLEQLIRSQLGN